MKKSGLADSPFFKSLSQGGDDFPPRLAKNSTGDLEQKRSGKTKVAQAPTAPKEQPATDEDENMLASKHASMHAYMQASMHAVLSERATYTFAFRYPPELLEKLADVQHEIRKRHKKKLSKNAIAVAALVFLLTDFEIYGEESVLYQMLARS
jgi:hypothetical protein